MATTTTAWQLGEELKGRLLPVLRDVRELKGKIDLEISHKQDEMEFGSVHVHNINSPVPEDPAKMNRLGESLIRNIKEVIRKYEELCNIEMNRYDGKQETGHVSTTCPDVDYIDQENMVLPISETDQGMPSPVITDNMMEVQDTEQDSPNAMTRSLLERVPSSRPRLTRFKAVEKETVDLDK